MSQTQSSEYQKWCPRGIYINFNINFWYVRTSVFVDQYQ